jgi:hypothetical protein
MPPVTPSGQCCQLLVCLAIAGTTKFYTYSKARLCVPASRCAAYTAHHTACVQLALRCADTAVSATLSAVDVIGAECLQQMLCAGLRLLVKHTSAYAVVART